MLIQHLVSRRALSSSRAPFISRFQLSRRPKISIKDATRRFASSAPSRTPPKKKLLPESFLIYHSGTGRTVFLGSLKVTTIFIATFFCTVVAPTYFYAEDQPAWVSTAVVVSGIIPMVCVLYTTGPYVNYIHLRLPKFVRHSREMLERYSKNPPKEAEIDITTMNFLGKPRVARMKIADLYPVRERFGLANYARDTTTVNANRRWWMGKAVRQFGVHTGKGHVVGGGVWKNIEATVARRNERTPRTASRS
ncbi:hypothetical protein LSUE1_G004246 [Lachnellula suecica]|uniref:Uncharacterized protein n=1 Tax=Lachnellula suecica TaxID=602035 RepID=A0A8T9CBF7_9HELO|nr:hypothetical protein LSUE1_G004246 [Lachnellula suecica]